MSVDARLVQLVQGSVDVTLVHVPLGMWRGSVGGVSWRRGCDGLSTIQGRWCISRHHLRGVCAARGSVPVFPSTRDILAVCYIRFVVYGVDQVAQARFNQNQHRGWVHELNLETSFTRVPWQ